MATVNMSVINKAIGDILKANLLNDLITINEKRNTDYNKAAQKESLINIVKGGKTFNTVAIGSRPWLVEVKPIVEIQCTSFKSGEDAVEKLIAKEDQVLSLLMSNKKLGGYVDMTNGYDIVYEVNLDVEKDKYLQASVITILAEVRA